MIKIVKNTVPCTYIISDLENKKIVRTFCKRELQKHPNEVRVEKVIKIKSNKLYVKWKDCDSYVNSWIDKKDIV